MKLVDTFDGAKAPLSINPEQAKGFSRRRCEWVDIYIDGASKGNPGHAGIGVVILKDGRVLKTLSNYIGKNTNNFAEYSALIYALEEALIIKAEILRINSDSQLLCRQLNKEYKVKSENIMSLYNQAVHLLAAFKEVTINHIPREKNEHADKLATQAVKEAIRNNPNLR